MHTMIVATLLLIATATAEARERQLNIVCPTDHDLQRSRVVARIAPAGHPGVYVRPIVRCGEPDVSVHIDDGDVVQLIVRVKNTRLGGMVTCRQDAPDWLADISCSSDLGTVRGVLWKK
jgi:hypothetical protein